MNVAGGAREEAGVLRDIELQEAPGQHLHRRPVDQTRAGAARTSVSRYQIAAGPSPTRCGASDSRRRAAQRACSAHCAASAASPRRARRRGTPLPAFRGCSACGRSAGVSSSSIAAALHDDDALAQRARPRSCCARRAAGSRRVSARDSARDGCAPSRRCRDRARRSARRAAEPPAG